MKRHKVIGANFLDDFDIGKFTEKSVEIKVLVLERFETKDNQYRYKSGLLATKEEYDTVEFKGKQYVDLGKTFVTKLMANTKQILTVGVEGMILKGRKLQWLDPQVIGIDEDITEPYTADQVIDLANKSNVLQKVDVDYKLDDTGKGVTQIHIMGIEEEEVAKLKDISSEAKTASITKLKMLLKGAVGEKACHLDIRLKREGDNYFEGGEIMVGNFTGLSKIDGFLDGKKLRFGWKDTHVEESMSWMNAGSKGIEIFEPGKPGGSVNKYGAMLRLDEFEWKLIQADEHAKKLELSGSKLFGDKILLVAYVPVAQGQRIWVASLLSKEIEKGITIIPLQKNDEQVVCGIVYEPDEVDSQGDTTDAEEIRKACFYFMEHGGEIRLNHKGSRIDATVLENYIAPADFVVEGRPVKKGSWVMSVRVNDEKIWKGIKDGDFQGFSMAGYTGYTDIESK